ncbi:LOG family protein [Planctomycetota bacterium]
MTIRTISIFGTSRAGVGDAVYQLAYDVGSVLAHSGFVIANGGYGGTMLAAAKGAFDNGGEVVGVTCSAFSSDANKYVSSEIKTGCLTERLDKLIELGDGYVVLPGGTGTLLELAKVWELKNKGFLKKDKPIILVGGFWKSLIELIEIDDPKCGIYVQTANEPKDIIELLKKFLPE